MFQLDYINYCDSQTTYPNGFISTSAGLHSSDTSLNQNGFTTIPNAENVPEDVPEENERLIPNGNCLPVREGENSQYKDMVGNNITDQYYGSQDSDPYLTTTHIVCLPPERQKNAKKTLKKTEEILEEFKDDQHDFEGASHHGNSVQDIYKLCSESADEYPSTSKRCISAPNQDKAPQELCNSVSHETYPKCRTSTSSEDLQNGNDDSQDSVNTNISYNLCLNGVDNYLPTDKTYSFTQREETKLGLDPQHEEEGCDTKNSSESEAVYPWNPIDCDNNAGILCDINIDKMCDITGRSSDSYTECSEIIPLAPSHTDP